MSSSSAQEPAGLTILTLSFAGDLEPCRLLCETVDRFVAPDVTHLLAVPRADLPLFAPFGSTRRRLIAQEALLPPWLHKLPLPSPAWRKRLFLPRRNVYVTNRGRPVRGWIAQQIMKLAAAAQVDTDRVIHMDSDAALVRPLRPGDLGRDGRARLFRLPGDGDTPMHAKWHAAASRLLGLPDSGYHGADYIDNLVVWRRPIVQRLLAHVARIGRAEAAAVLARTPDFSEYILYGVYCDRIFGLEAAGHVADPETLCATLWSDPRDAGVAVALKPRQLAVGIQSTIPMADAQRRAIVGAAIATASRLPSPPC